MGNQLRGIAALLIVGMSAVGAGAAKEHVAQRFEVTGTVQPDGSLDVVEVIAFRFTGGEYTTVTRELRATETDGVDVLEAAMDGSALPRGDDAGQVDVDASRRGARITWRFAPTRDRVHVFSLRYRYRGVVRHGDGEDWFRWPPFPSRFDYPIETGVARVIWPAAARAPRLPDVEGPVASTAPLENGFSLSVSNYRQADQDVVMTVRFEPGAFPGEEPEWEQDRRRAASMAPAFFAAAAMIIAATVIVIWLFLLRYRRDGADLPGAGTVTSPPDQLPAPVAGSIADGRVSTGSPQLLAAVFDLARRGVVTIEEQHGGFASGRRFLLKRGDEAPLRPFERTVLDALFKDGARDERFDRALRRMGSHARKVGAAIRAELAADGFVDQDRQDGSRGLTIGGIVVILFAAALFVVLAAIGMRLGAAALAVPFAFAASGLAMVITAAAFSTLTPSGLRAARAWDAYRAHLKDELRQGRAPADGEAIGRMLPYAAALGLLSRFGKALEKTDVRDVPAWLRTLDAAGGRAAMIAIMTSGSRSVSSGGGGGGAGGGVGAGGSSGAR